MHVGRGKGLQFRKKSSVLYVTRLNVCRFSQSKSRRTDPKKSHYKIEIDCDPDKIPMSKGPKKKVIHDLYF